MRPVDVKFGAVFAVDRGVYIGDAGGSGARKRRRTRPRTLLYLYSDLSTLPMGNVLRFRAGQGVTATFGMTSALG